MTEPHAAPEPAPRLRIDDLAHESGLTVDTIRYYQREGLLPPGERSGRLNLYGPEHLERLERIKDLQTRRFSLAACKALLEEHREGLVDELFGGAVGRSYSYEELIERSEVDPELAAGLHDIGLLRDPADFGRNAYDNEDLELLRTMGDLANFGFPNKALVEIGRIYAEGIEATQQEIVELFTTGGRVDWASAEELTDFQDRTGTHASEILPRARRIVDYTHHRTIQRLTRSAIERGALHPLRDE